MTLDLIEVKPRLNVKKVVIITIVLILIISLISTAIFFGVRQYNKNLSIIERDILAKNRPAHELFYSDNAKQNKIVERVSHIYNSDYRRVFLTFDDGPSKSVTIPILDILKQNNVKATFFVLGSNAERYPEIVKRAYQEGNQIGTHTQNHKNLKLLSNDEFLYEVNNSIIEIKNIIGVEPTLLRPPYGNIDSHMKNQLLMHTILWNVDSIDWKLKDRNLIKKEILKNVSDGSIVLLHDIYTESVEGALLAMEELEKEGYAFVTIEEMAQIKGIDLDYNTSYFNF